MATDFVVRANFAPHGAEQPGKYPFTRGITSEPHPWIMGQYSGFGTPEESNTRLRELLDAGVTGFSVALDLPTQLGLDSDDPRARGEVGRVGVAIDSLADIEVLMDGIPLEAISQVRTTANSIGFVWAALFVALARRRKADPNSFGMFIQNDVLKEFFARGTQIFPPEESLRLAVDTIEYCSKELPNWTPLAMSGYHIRESGATAAQEVAFTFANACAYLDACVERGVSIDQVAPKLFTFLAITPNVLLEVAKLRAARRVWAKLIQNRYSCPDPESQKLRIFAFTAGSSLTAQQPMNNIVRTTIETVIAATCNVQTLHVAAYDEALGVPTAAAALTALRTQQVVALESGLLDTLDPWGGSYAVESLTDDLEQGIASVMREVESRGGALACIDSGWFNDELATAAYRDAEQVENGQRRIVGVNAFASESEPLEVFDLDPHMEERQSAALQRTRESRDQQKVDRALSDLRSAALGGGNIVPATITAVDAYATLGEIIDVLRSELGQWQP